MIRLSEGELLDMLPSEFKRQPEVVALSYALKQAYRRLLAFQAGILVYAYIDGCSEAVLDMLAVELRMRYYDQSFSIDKKRELIKSGILVGLRDGTKYAVDLVVSTILDAATTMDWYEYGGDPGCYRIRADVTAARGDIDLNGIIDAIEMVKRKSAHLDGVSLVASADQGLFFGSVLQETTVVSIGCEDLPEGGG